MSLANSCTMTAGVALLSSPFVASVPLGATSVVALVDRENNRLVLAADCRVNRNHDSVSQCKIIEDRDCVVVIAGLYTEPSTQFNLRKLVSDGTRSRFLMKGANPRSAWDQLKDH